MLENLYIEIIVAVIMFVLGYITNKAKLYFVEINPKRRIIQFNDNCDISIISSCIDNTNVTIKEFTGYGFKSDLLAASNMLLLLNRTYRNLKLQIYLECDTYNLREHIVVVGGIKYNKLTAKILSNKSIPYYMDNFTIIDREKNIEYAAIVNMDQDYIEKDYAIIINCKNPYNNKKRLIFFAGCRPAGTQAAGEFWATIHKNKVLITQILNALEESKSYAILLLVEGYSNNVGIPKVIDFKSFYFNS